MSYDPQDDEMTIYIAYVDSERYGLKGWTADKKLMKYFLKFHNCNKIKCKKYTDTIKNINEFINYNSIHEININRVRSKDMEGNAIYLYVPTTLDEIGNIVDNSFYFTSSNIQFGLIEYIYNKLKPKYQSALNILLLNEIIKHIGESHSNPNNILKNNSYKIERDMIASLYSIEPELFK